MDSIMVFDENSIFGCCGKARILIDIDKKREKILQEGRSTPVPTLLYHIKTRESAEYLVRVGEQASGLL